MVVLSSRAPEEAARTISVTEDLSVDPPVLKIIQTGRPEHVLLLRTADDRITVFDLIRVLNKLDIYVDYQEIR